MSDDLSPLQSRIKKIIGDEERLNRNRLTGIKAKKDRRDAEKRSETANIVTLEKAVERQKRVSEEKERKFEEDMKREGDALAASQTIRDDFLAETRHREAVKSTLQTQLSTLESKLRTIESGRP